MKKSALIQNVRDSFLTGGAALAVAVGTLAIPVGAGAHGFAGQRFFPATIATDDPFVADELSLPTLSTIRFPGEDGAPGGREYDLGVDVSKRITPQFAISLGETVTRLEPDRGKAVNGFQNLEVGMKYQFWKSEDHEAILSAGVDAEVGGTGKKAVGAESASVVAPGIFFGKGLGDLPDSLSLVRPLAVTGQMGVALPTDASPDSLEYGFAIEYSLIYLQEHVKDIGLPKPFDRMIPLVEFALETPLNRGEAGETTGTINPGIVWSGKFFQVGAEAIVPMNSRSGGNVGAEVQLHFYLDDVFPHSFGRPIFGR